MLLERGAELDCLNDNEETPRELFKRGGQEDLRQLSRLFQIPMGGAQAEA